MTLLSDLNIVGTGIKAVSHLTIESRTIISACDRVFYVVTDPLAESMLLELNPTASSMLSFYEEGRYRGDTYRDMAAALVASVRAGYRTCGVFYGHPSVFVTPSLAAVRTVRDAGYTARVYPGISAEDCLFADLEVDPGSHGCQSFEASDFLARRKQPDCEAHLLIWQVAATGDSTYSPRRDPTEALNMLGTHLRQFYPLDYSVAFYEAALYSVSTPRIDWFPLGTIGTRSCGGLTTLYVPPKRISWAVQ